jgi:hypothetical protein
MHKEPLEACWQVAPPATALAAPTVLSVKYHHADLMKQTVVTHGFQAKGFSLAIRACIFLSREVCSGNLGDFHVREQKYFCDNDQMLLVIYVEVACSDVPVGGSDH